MSRLGSDQKYGANLLSRPVRVVEDYKRMLRDSREEHLARKGFTKKTVKSGSS